MTRTNSYFLSRVLRWVFIALLIWAGFYIASGFVAFVKSAQHNVHESRATIIDGALA